LFTASSIILLNGIPTKPLKQERGLQHGDTISSMLFILAMDTLQQILYLATEKGVLHPISARARGIKTSLYEDDAAIFVGPSKWDIAALKCILDSFGQASGLCTNLQKSELFSIGCSGLQLDQILEGFLAAVKAFPCCYLG
jgi:hypothetical protein